MKLVGAVLVLLLFFTSQGDCWRRRRARPACYAHNCVIDEWSAWTRCSHDCGSSGIETRTRRKVEVESCGGTCYHTLIETRACNRHCFNEGTPMNGYCKCKEGFTGRCCEHGKLIVIRNSSLRSVVCKTLHTILSVYIKSLARISSLRGKYSPIFAIRAAR